MKSLTALLDGISDSLEEADFTDNQKFALREAFGKDKIVVIIKDVCDSKGAGLFEHMAEAVGTYRLEREARLEVFVGPPKPEPSVTKP